MKLQTHIPLTRETKNGIDYQSDIVLLGSCFSENIGQKLQGFKFQTFQNPLGILFHPKAIERLILQAVNQKTYDDKDVFFYKEQWHCFEAHSRLSRSTKEEMIQTLNNQIQATFCSLQRASHIIVTLGTAWAYRYLDTDTLVANCHKVPQKKFAKELLSVQDVKESLETMVSLIRQIKPNSVFIFSISPVRHLKDGVIENQLSKAHLISAVHQVVNSIKGSYYFPSYEILMDELRDYRFYADDMVHPSSTAIHYIWERFIDTWISKEATATMKQVDSIQKRLQHKPFNVASKEYQKFIEKTASDIKKVTQANPHISF